MCMSLVLPFTLWGRKLVKEKKKKGGHALWLRIINVVVEFKNESVVEGAYL